MVAYDSLKELEHSSLVMTSTHQDVKLFGVADLNILTIKAEEFAIETEEIVQELRDLRAETSCEVQVKHLLGKQGFWENLQLLTLSSAKQKNRLMRIIGAGDDRLYYDALGDKYAQYSEMCKKLRVGKRLMTESNEQELFWKKAIPGTVAELKVLPPRAFHPMYTRITEEYVSFEVHKPKVSIIQIKSRTISENHIDSFDYIWNSLPNKKTPTRF